MAKLLKMLWEYMDLTVLPFFETWSAHIFGGWQRVCWCTNEAFNQASPTKEFWENCPQKKGGHIYGKNEGWAYLRKLLYFDLNTQIYLTFTLLRLQTDFLEFQSTDKCQGNHSTLTLTRSDKSLRWKFQNIVWYLCPPIPLLSLTQKFLSSCLFSCHKGESVVMKAPQFLSDPSPIIGNACH